jgi:hypothetical protein
VINSQYPMRGPPPFGEVRLRRESYFAAIAAAVGMAPPCALRSNAFEDSDLATGRTATVEVSVVPRTFYEWWRGISARHRPAHHD